MAEVYAVATGYYSDYRIDALFADRATAEAYIARRKRINGESDDTHDEPEVYALLEAPPVPVRVYCARRLVDPLWNATADADPTQGVQEWSYVCWSHEPEASAAQKRPLVEVAGYTVFARGGDPEAVRRALYDRVARLKAEQRAEAGAGATPPPAA